MSFDMNLSSPVQIYKNLQKENLAFWNFDILNFVQSRELEAFKSKLVKGHTFTSF